MSNYSCQNCGAEVPLCKPCPRCEPTNIFLAAAGIIERQALEIRELREALRNERLAHRMTADRFEQAQRFAELTQEMRKKGGGAHDPGLVPGEATSPPVGAAGGEWKSIVVAPKTGEILGWCPDKGVIRVLFWCINKGWTLCGGMYPPRDADIYQPTHYMMLPSPPKVKQHSGEIP